MGMPKAQNASEYIHLIDMMRQKLVQQLVNMIQSFTLEARFLPWPHLPTSTKISLLTLFKRSAEQYHDIAIPLPKQIHLHQLSSSHIEQELLRPRNRPQNKPIPHRAALPHTRTNSQSPHQSQDPRPRTQILFTRPFPGNDRYPSKLNVKPTPHNCHPWSAVLPTP